MRIVVPVFIFLLFGENVLGQVHTPIDDQSQVEFKIKNFGVIVKGSFKGLKGTIVFDPKALDAAAFDVSVEASTVATGKKMRDNHLQKKEYFDVNVFPRIRFVSTKVMPTGKPGQFTISGKLTIKNTTKEIAFPFSYSDMKFYGVFKLDRKDYDIGGDSFSLSDEVVLNVSIIVKKIGSD